jgi:DNA repair protein SbcD/Mre11
MCVRVLLLADTHLGFDLPIAPRIHRRRRGLDFLANYRRALAPALAGDVELVVHAGDVFHRARPHPTLVAQAFEPLLRVAELGIPVFVVPGNHERSRIPHARFAAHPRIHVFGCPRTFRVVARGRRVALLGFPYERGAVRDRFLSLVGATGWRPGEDDLSFLCLHHCFEGATVGPGDFTFRYAPDVVRCREIPRGVTAVLTGHVHRHQVLVSDLDGGPLPAPVVYPGSVERTAFAEKDEPKGYVILQVDGPPSSRAVDWTFQPLPARPMVVAEVRADGLSATALRTRLAAAIAAATPDAVLRLRILGRVAEDARAVLAAPALRALAPPEMNVETVPVDEPRRRPVRARASR